MKNLFYVGAIALFVLTNLLSSCNNSLTEEDTLYNEVENTQSIKKSRFRNEDA